VTSSDRATGRGKRLLALLGAPVAVALVVSGIAPYDRATWFLEVAPVLIAAPIIAFTWRRFPLTTLLCVLAALHALVLIYGGAYTYARVPLGFQMQELLGLQRNPYDRLGHLMQGFVPAILAREILVRGNHVQGSRMLAFVCICIAVAFSAVYELIEWGTALALGGGSIDFLGTQGDIWDAQADMLCALIGAVVALATLSSLHDRQLRALIETTKTPPVTAASRGEQR
jgi:putative membrane protein